MAANDFKEQETVAKNLIAFMRQKGYSRLSLSKLSGIPRTVIDQLLNSGITDESVYNLQIERINDWGYGLTKC